MKENQGGEISKEEDITEMFNPIIINVTYNDFEVVVGLTKTPILARASTLRWSSLPKNQNVLKNTQMARFLLYLNNNQTFSAGDRPDLWSKGCFMSTSCQVDDIALQAMYDKLSHHD